MDSEFDKLLEKVQTLRIEHSNQMEAKCKTASTIKQLENEVRDAKQEIVALVLRYHQDTSRSESSYIPPVDEPYSDARLVTKQEMEEMFEHSAFDQQSRLPARYYEKGIPKCPMDFERYDGKRCIFFDGKKNVYNIPVAGRYRFRIGIVTRGDHEWYGVGVDAYICWTDMNGDKRRELVLQSAPWSDDSNINVKHVGLKCSADTSVWVEIEAKEDDALGRELVVRFGGTMLN